MSGRFAKFCKDFRRDWLSVAMSFPLIVHLFIFAYLPMWGILMAFQDFKIARGVSLAAVLFRQKWIGLEHFAEYLGSAAFGRTMINTIAMSAIGLVLGSFFSVFFAVMLNETRGGLYKKTIQTISYLPHFVSWVVAANIVISVLSPDGGIVNELLLKLGLLKQPLLFMGEEQFFWWIIGWSNVWKGMGWGAIIYLAAMTSIDPQLYEAADLDGAKRLQRIYHITLPGIRSTFVLLLILSIGALIAGGFEQQYLLQNPLVSRKAETIAIYTFQQGLVLGEYSYATAVGLFVSVVNFLLLVGANKIAKWLDQETLF